MTDEMPSKEEVKLAYGTLARMLRGAGFTVQQTTVLIAIIESILDIIPDEVKKH